MTSSMARTGIAAIGVIGIVLATAATAQATNDPLFDSGTSDGFDVVADDGFGTSDTSFPTDITITGEPDEDLPDEAAALDGTYVISAGGSRQTAVLGAITFDPTGLVVTGALTIVSAAEPSAAPVGLPTGGDGSGDDFGDGDDPLAPAPTGTATVTDCTATGGSYTLSEGGAGEAQVELDCSGSELTAVWRLSVIAGDGFGQAQQVRAVQTDPVGEDGITELVLTLR